jgi:predicted secreted hydrolase
VRGNRAPLDLDLNSWAMRGGNGEFVLAADMPGYAIHLETTATKPAALHDGDGHIDYGDGTSSHYYSWTRLLVSGSMSTEVGSQPVRGLAWMDHQWGDFTTFQDGGWDWFAVQLEDGTDVMLYVVRDADGATLRVDGSIVEPDGTLTVLGAGDFSVVATGEWTSPVTGTVYPSGWEVELPNHELAMNLAPTVLDQELDTRPTTGVIYWEGQAVVNAMFGGAELNGMAYVELTGYAPFVPIDFGTPATSLEP